MGSLSEIESTTAPVGSPLLRSTGGAFNFGEVEMQTGELSSALTLASTLLAGISKNGPMKLALLKEISLSGCSEFEPKGLIIDNGYSTRAG